jgi:hypothetical protein
MQSLSQNGTSGAFMASGYIEQNMIGSFIG